MIRVLVADDHHLVRTSIAHLLNAERPDEVNALLAAGLRIARLEEYPFANGWKGFDGMREGEGKRWYAPPGQAAIPLMYGLEALQP